MPPSQKTMPSSSSTTEFKPSHSNSINTNNSTLKQTTATSATGRTPRGPNANVTTSTASGNKDRGRHPNSNNNNNNNNGNYSNSKHSSTSTIAASSAPALAGTGTGPNYYDAHSESDDSYAVGGGFISEMDEHDSAFDGAMEYDGEDGRSLLGDDFDASSDVAVDTPDGRKEKRSRDFQDRLLKLELEFEENKQTIFDYQMARYKEEMDAILNGVHPDFHDQLQDLAETRDITIASARLYRDYQFECAQHAYELETELAEEEYMTEREGLREKMLAVIDSKRRALRDDKENLDISNDFALEPTSRANNTRRLRKRGQEMEAGAKNSKRKTNQPPMAKWLASDADALDDLSLIRKVFASGTTKKSGTVKKK